MYGLIQLPSIQTWIIGKASKSLSKKLGVTVSIEHVNLKFFNHLEFEKLLIRDQKGDTLTYAGKAEIDVTNWFFLKNHFTINDVYLKDGTIKLNRVQKKWNYQFILDHFKTDNTTNNNNLNFDLKKIHLSKFRVEFIDGWIGEDMITSFDDLQLRFGKTNLSKGQIDIDEAKLEKPLFGLVNYDGKRTEAEEKIEKSEKQHSGKSAPYAIAIIKLSIKNGTFTSDEPTDRPVYANLFDELHINFSAINANLSNVNISPIELTAQLELNAKERSGFKVNKLSALVRIDSSIMEFRKLIIETDKSKIGNYYAMKYKDFNNDMKDFLNRVELIGMLKETRVHTDDIAFFAPELKSWNRNILVSAKTSGTLNRFEIRDLVANSQKTLIQGDVSLRDIDKIDNMFLIVDSKGTITNFEELSSLAPGLSTFQKPTLSRLGNIYYKGNFTGYLTDFVAKGILKTDLGQVATDIKFNLNKGSTPTYQGAISTQHFNLGKLINEPLLGDLSLNGKVKGEGFTLQSIKTNFSGKVDNIYFNKYNYKAINLDGSFEKNNFFGNLSIADSNLNIKYLKGKIVFEKDKATVNITSDIQHVNLGAINALDKNIRFAGKLDMNFSGSDIDHVQGEAIIHEGSLEHENKVLPFTGLTLTASKSDSNKSITLKSSNLDASISGKYTIKQLPDAFKLFLHNYYPAYITKPKLNLSDQQFVFTLQTKNVDELMKVLVPTWEGGNNASIIGALNLAKNEFKVDANIPDFSLKNNILKNINISGIGDLDTLSVRAKLGDYYSSDSLHLSNSVIEIKSKDDISMIQLHSGQEGTLNEANLHAEVQTFADGFGLHLMPSSLVLNGKKWDIKKDGEFSIKEKHVYAKDIAFTHNDQSITLDSELDELTDHSNLKATLNKVEMGDFLPLLVKKTEVSGIITGTILLSDPLGKQNLDFNAQVDSLTIEKELIGKISANGIAQTKEGQLNFHAHSMDTTNEFDLIGNYQFGPTNKNKFYSNLKAKKIKLSILRPYLNDVFDDLDGTATSDLSLTYGEKEEFLTGQVLINKASLKVGYTQVRYFIEEQPIVFKEDEIFFNLLQLNDSLGNTAVMGGKIFHHFFDDFNFKNLRIETSKLSLLNTSKKDNPQFYGKAIGRAKMNINGPLNNLRMQIDAEPMSLDSSHIYLSTSEGKESNSIDYIDFKEPIKKDSIVANSESNNIVITINVKANPACKVDVILDEETGDVIKGQGNGNISVTVGNIEPLRIRGNYELLTGEYTFNFQTYLKRPFTLMRGGTITWNGDPYQALINIDAEYLAKNVDISSLSTTGFQQKVDLKIISHLSGNLQNPTVKFEFVLPEQRSEAKRDDILVKRLAEFKNDENEMNKQVASLLLFNTFIVGNQNFLTQGNASSLITNTIGGAVSNLLTSFFNRELEKATKGLISTYIEINQTLDLQKGASQLQANIRAGLKILLDKRLVVLVGGNLDYNNPTYAQQLERKGLLTPDITIEWLINKDGSLRVVGFNRSSIDFTLNQRNRSGLQLSYRKDFNKLSDIFKSRKRLTQEDKLIYLPAIKPED